MDLQQGGFYINCNANSFLRFPGTICITECRGERKITRTFINLESIMTHVSLCLITLQAVNPTHFLHHQKKKNHKHIQNIFERSLVNLPTPYHPRTTINEQLHFCSPEGTAFHCHRTLPYLKNETTEATRGGKPKLEQRHVALCIYNKTELCINERSRFLALYS